MEKKSRELCCIVALLLHVLVVMAQVGCIGRSGLLPMVGQWWMPVALGMAMISLVRCLMAKMSLAESLSPEMRWNINQAYFVAGVRGGAFDAAWLLLQYFAAWLVVKWLFGECWGSFDNRVVWLVASCLAVSLAYGTHLAYCGFRYDIKYRSFKLDPASQSLRDRRAMLAKESRLGERKMSRREKWLTLALVVHCVAVWAEGVLWVRDATAWGRNEWVGGLCVWASMLFLLKYWIVFFEQPLRADIGERNWLSGVKGLLAVALDLGYLAQQFDLVLFALVWVFAGQGSNLNGLAKAAIASVIGSCLAFGAYMAYCAVKFDVKYRVFIPNLNRRRIPSKSKSIGE